MNIRPEEVSSILKQRLKSFQVKVEAEDVGTVIQVGDGIARVYGLKDCMSDELLIFPGNVYGMALNLEEDNIGCVLLGSDHDIKEGDTVKRTGKIAEITVGEELLGRVVNAMIEPIDNKGEIKGHRRTVKGEAMGIVDRQPVRQPLQTGLKVIDALTPIGKGQRELIIGDRQTGKSAIAIDTIINQKGKNVICIYVAIGQKASTVAHLVKTLEEHNAMDYTIIVAASASESAPLQYIAPFAACSVGEYFMHKGQDALVIFDDLSKHAVAYREMSLLLRRPPGREAYPGDVFYLHSRLLERAAKLSEANGGGSLTALPIVETQAGELSYIPTNVISITDGQIFLEPELFFSGIRPAMNAGVSVSRVGGNAQTKAMKKVAGRLRIDLAQYRELAMFAQFGSELDSETKEKLEQGKRVQEILKQSQYNPMEVEYQVISIFAATRGYLKDVEIEDIKSFEAGLIQFIKEQYHDIASEIKATEDLSKETEERLGGAISSFKEIFKKKTER